MDLGSELPFSEFSEQGSSADGTFDAVEDEVSASEKLVQKREVLRNEVASLKEQAKQVAEYLKTQTTCASRNAEIESTIRFVGADMDLLSVMKSELEDEIENLESYMEHNQDCRTEIDGNIEQQEEGRVNALHEKLLEFRLKNGIFDDDLQSPQALSDTLSECRNFLRQVKGLRRQLTRASAKDLESPEAKNAYRDALQSYTELMLQYFEARLSRVKLFALRLRKVKSEL